MSEVLDVIKERSSIRKYRQDTLTEEIDDKLLHAGLQAPTARNTQELHFSVVRGGHPVLAELDKEKKQVIAASLEDQTEKDNILNQPDNFYFDAPVVIFVDADKDFGWSQVDAGIAVENIALAAQSLGLGSLIIGSVKRAFEGEKKAYFETTLQFPENHEFAIAIGVGYKDTEKEPHTYDPGKAVSFIK